MLVILFIDDALLDLSSTDVLLSSEFILRLIFYGISLFYMFASKLYSPGKAKGMSGSGEPHAQIICKEACTYGREKGAIPEGQIILIILFLGRHRKVEPPVLKINSGT